VNAAPLGVGGPRGFEWDGQAVLTPTFKTPTSRRLRAWLDIEGDRQSDLTVRHVRGLIEFQRLTGCRPGEACAVWHPNQLRHSFATRVRKGYGLEAARVLLGHSRADGTQAYAERDQQLAATVAAKIG
jgi:site-specific recombinase XerC